jgi:hypothetical protein
MFVIPEMDSRFWSEVMATTTRYTVVLKGVLSRFPTRGRFHQRFTSSFFEQRSQKRSRHWYHQCLFALSGSSSVKASRKYVDWNRPPPRWMLPTELFEFEFVGVCISSMRRKRSFPSFLLSDHHWRRTWTKLESRNEDKKL